MKDHILHHIEQIEKQHNVKVLYACDAGSRAYGLHAPRSDYDIRFIYIHKPVWYLSIDQQRDVIELPVDDLLDMNGWDLQKTLKLFRKSNPPLFEWLQSELVYISDSFFLNSIKQLEVEVFSPVPVLFHYFHMAKGNVKDYLMQDEVKVKKYLHVLRPILMCKWIETYKKAPPIHFDKLLNDLLLHPGVKQALHYLKEVKKSQDGQIYVDRSPILHAFIEREVEHLETYIQAQDTTKKEITPQLNQLFLETLQHTWGK
ncbi:nucleotidyltransferase domain-containing protein [Pontibacillus sp. HMF3514]|uniref:nucleotidyltransferase domain-containing protein n=1 Tax=Pontibacillus sp. HMF3514 TaxID=2692425 RepID=UPI00131FCD4A|nr:nucleotidyltransferase domain-containing protein [Pontibacillus sp. HMF3514]QHE51268.1 nucleotidyltransferase domain-containing protein [Pontibacillus sp. HMF3514]